MNAGKDTGQPAEQNIFDVAMSQAWRQFRGTLADAMAALPEGGDLLVRVDLGEALGQNSVWASALVEDGQIRVEVPANSTLAPGSKLGPQAMRQLRDLGLARPYSSSASYVLDLPLSRVDQAASVITSALRDCYLVLHPSYALIGDLRAGSTQTTRAEPSPLPVAVAAQSHEHLHGLVAHAITRLPGVETQTDEEGQFLISTDAAMVTASVHPHSPVILLRAVVLRGISRRKAARAEAARLTKESGGVTFVVYKDWIIAGMDVIAAPFVPAHLAIAVSQLAGVVERVAVPLRAKVGGETFAHPSVMIESRAEAVTGYLLHMLIDGPLTAKQVAEVCEHDADLVVAVIDLIEDEASTWLGTDDQKHRAIRLLRRALRLVLLD